MRRSVRHPWRVLLLVAIAAALNVISIPLPGELQLFLAPLAYMPLVLLLPLPWAALAAALPMAVTIFTLEQPFVFFIATAEAAWLAVAHRHWRRATVFHDAIFWLVAGVPAFGGLYRVIGHLPTDVVAIIAIKQIFNQLVAVVTAVFVLRYTRLASWIADRSVARRCLRDTVLLSTSVLALAPLVAVAFGLSVLLRVYCEREDREMLLGGASRMARHFGLYLQLHEATVASIANTPVSTYSTGMRVIS